ncbi:hypothetical protein WOLCODRAFT_135730 [Wolfiporia cocos MD-104 SS10]|uniref:C2 domain-containing protein n=1 Tax=Wolfiporia cocos (strain MD-104) TaxID=742152 RepID=A0A2H3IWY0_WOLCO|nr:hypothetical protein WOLCODRAFT_135730 [Wolfiporia cocos MD-104 SS10]
MPEALHSFDPWYLTVVRTHGLLFVRPEKSWRPIVSIAVSNSHQLHEVVLGCDGQNPNLRSPFVLREVDPESKLDIKVWHKSHKKSRKKRHLVGSSYIALSEILRNQSSSGGNLDLRLNCPPPQKKSPLIKGKQQHCAILTIRLRQPPSLSPSSTLIDADEEDDCPSDCPSQASRISDTTASATLDGTRDQSSDNETDNVLNQDGQQLRRRKRIKGYCIDSGDELGDSTASDSYPPTPRDEHFPPFRIDDESESGEDKMAEPSSSSLGGWLSAMSLPLHVDQISVHGSLSLAESIVDSFAPYRELQEATLDADYDKVLGRLLTEWYVVGASLLALAGIDAAVFGLAPGSILPIDSVAQHAVALGAIAAGLGLLIVSWFLLIYSGANTEKFKRFAKDVYHSYFFFCLTCRLPTLCMFFSALALMIFLLTVAWSAWPTAVLVFSFVCGIVFTLQYLVFGFHRCMNFCIWAIEVVWRFIARRGSRNVAASVQQQQQVVPPASRMKDEEVQVAVREVQAGCDYATDS